MLRYLRGTARLDVVFRKLKIGKPKLLQGYVDADYAGDLDEQRFMTGYEFTVARSVVS